MKKISLIIPAYSKGFYIEDMLINILFWNLKTSEIIIVNTYAKKIINNKNIKKKLKKENINLIIINKKIISWRC